MHFRIISKKLKAGDLRHTAQVVAGTHERYTVGTFDSKDRAALAAKIFILWCERYPLHAKNKLSKPFANA